MRVEQAAPVLLSADLGRTAAWYRDALGWEFELYGEPPDFGTAHCDGVRIFYALCPEPGLIVPNWRVVDAVWNVYVRVEDVDAAHDELVARGTPLDYGLCDQPYGMREFGVQDPDGHDIGFGRPIAG